MKDLPVSPFFLGVGLALSISLILFVWTRSVRLATAWGALWGLAMGFLVIAPQVLHVHHLHPEGFRDWLIVDAFFGLVFTVLGVLLSALASWPLGVHELVRRRTPLRNVFLATGLWSAVCLPVAYLVLAALIEWGFFSRLPPADGHLTVIFTSSASLCLMVLGSVVAYRWCIGHDPNAAARWLGYGAVLGVSLGIAALWFRAEALPSASGDDVPPLVSRPADRSPAPLLVIGLDGGNWRTLRPLVERGSVPTFARIAASGLQGETRALWPPYWSTPAWGAILTGHSQEDIGVHQDMQATVAGLPAFELPMTLDLRLNPILLVELGLIHARIIEAAAASRDRLRRPPIWERLSQAGVKTAVVHFPFTYPATNQAAYVVSDRVVTDLWEMMGVETGRRTQLVSPASDEDQLLSWFSGNRGVAPSVLNQLLSQPDWPKPRDAIVNPSEVLRKTLDTSQRMFSVTEQIVKADPALSVVMLYATDFDSICHAFWPYRFPEDFPHDPPAPADVQALGPVIDRYLEYLDQRLGHLIAAFPTPPNVIVVADHGEGPAEMVTLWRGWHSELGLFLAAGPDVSRQGGLRAVSYFDVVPTMLDLLNLEKPSDLTGHSVIARR
jgi:hypothetical protein